MFFCVLFLTLALYFSFFLFTFLIHFLLLLTLVILLSFLLPPLEKRSKGLFHQITKTHGTVIGVSSGIVLVLLIISILVQMKQPRKKVTHPLWLSFCLTGNQTGAEEKKHTAHNIDGTPDIAVETGRKD